MAVNELMFTIAMRVADFNLEGCRVFFDPPCRHGRKMKNIKHEKDKGHERKAGGSRRESARIKDGKCLNVIRIDSRFSSLRPFVLFVVKNPPGEELNHDGTTDRTEEEMKSLAPRMNADKR